MVYKDDDNNEVADNSNAGARPRRCYIYLAQYLGRCRITYCVY